LAVNLALALRRQKQRVLLIDANCMRSDVATLLRLQTYSDLGEVTEGRRTLRQLLVEGPLGIQIIPSLGGHDGSLGARVLQLVRHLDSVACQFDWMLIDAGCCPLSAELLWPTSDQAVVVGGADFVAVTAVYGLIKSMHRKRAISQVATVISRSRSREHAEQARQRLTESCRRFLQLELPVWEPIPECAEVQSAENAGRPVLCSHPTSHAVQAITRISQQLASPKCAPDDLSSMPVA
jgi:flagellar biosynthesis protein FlhG